MLMDPNQNPTPIQPLPTAPSGQFNPGNYDFITNPKKPKKSFLPGAGSSKTQRIAIVTIGAIVILIVFILLYSLLTGGSKSNVAALTTVLQQQTELARVSELGSKQAGSDAAKNIAASTDRVMISESIVLKSGLKTQGIKISTKQILAGRNLKTDQDLSTAQANGRFDDAFTQAIRNQLSDYKKSLMLAYNSTSSKSLKSLLQQQYNDANLLLEQITGQPQT